MAKDAVASLEETRQKLITKLLDKRAEIDSQLQRLGHDDKKAAH
jgi:hypothetical protein